MLTRLDEHLVHQTPEPLARPATGDRNAYDRHWMCGLDTGGDWYFGMAFGRYPNRHVMDASFSILRDGVQHSIHASRLEPAEPTETSVGPVHLEITEALRGLRIRIEPNDTGIEAALEYRARTPAIEEERTTMHSEDRLQVDMTRFTQFGRWSGTVRTPDGELTVDPAVSYGTRDRSWGVRPIGEPAGGKPDPLPQVFWIWNPLHLEHECRLVGMFQDAEGGIWWSSGRRVPASTDPPPVLDADDTTVEQLRPTGQDLEFEPGSRFIRRATLAVERADGSTTDVELDPVLRFDMRGMGYHHPEWGHGMWKGELAVGGESWRSDDLDVLDPYGQHVQHVVRARVDGQVGVGTLEQIIFGPHRPSGFHDLLDVAP